MRLQDLKADLAKHAPAGRPDDALCAAMVVARRVADLYQNCPECHGSGRVPCGPAPAVSPCERCGGTGLVPSDKWWTAQVGTWWLPLARYLFGGDG